MKQAFGRRIPDAHSTVADRSGAAALHGSRILIVEDEYFIADDLAKAVHALGGQVVGPASTCAAGIELVRSTKIDLGVIDLNLNGEMAFPLVDVLVERNVPVVLATGYMNDVIPGAYHHLPCWVKPYLSFPLARSLAQLL